MLWRSSRMLVRWHLHCVKHLQENMTASSPLVQQVAHSPSIKTCLLTIFALIHRDAQSRQPSWSLVTWEQCSSTRSSLRDVHSVSCTFCHPEVQKGNKQILTDNVGALKLVAESFPWSRDSIFAHSRDNHTSVLGMREVAASQGASVKCIDVPTIQGAYCHTSWSDFRSWHLPHPWSSVDCNLHRDSVWIENHTVSYEMTRVKRKQIWSMLSNSHVLPEEIKDF